MTDVLLELGGNPFARKMIKQLGLPIPLPVRLRRDATPWQERPLLDQKAIIGAAAGAELMGIAAEAVVGAGASPFLATRNGVEASFRAAGEAFGRPPQQADALAEKERAELILFDASGITAVDGLRELYAFFHGFLPHLAKSGRVLVLARPPDAMQGAEASAAQAALDGFVRSVAKEIGRNGSTANLLLVARGAEKRMAPALRFFLSPRAAFVSAQPLSLDSRAKDMGPAPLTRPLERKVALVTGAARGIGAAIARALAQEGAHVVLLDRPAEATALSQLARELSGIPLLADLADEAAAQQIAGALKEQGVDVVIHNAGVTRDKTLAKMSPEQWDQVLGINLGAIHRLNAALEPLLRDGGRIVCLASVSGIAGNVGQAAYAASKAGLIGWVRVQAERFAARGITVNAVAPGFIETRMTAAMPTTIREAGRRLSALGQGGLPEDVAQVIGYLASPGAQGMTGRIVRICGGAYVGA